MQIRGDLGEHAKVFVMGFEAERAKGRIRFWAPAKTMATFTIVSGNQILSRQKLNPTSQTFVTVARDRSPKHW